MGIQAVTSQPRTTGAFLALATASALMLPCAQAEPASVQVPTVRAATGTSESSLEFDATLQAVRQATVSAQGGGNVLAMMVRAGDTVRAGQPLVRLDDRESAAGLSRSDAGVTQAEAEARNARLAAERSRELRAQGFISQAALDTAETQARASQAGLLQAQGVQRQAALAHGYSTITAPFDGIVLETLVEVGDLAVPGRALLTLYAPGAMRAVVQVPASRAGAIKAPARAVVALPQPDGTGVNWVAPIKQVELPGADPMAQTVEWRLDLPPDVAGRPGRSVRVRVTGAPSATSPLTPGTVSVPASAVLRRGELTAVYVARDGAFALRAIRAGATSSDGRTPVLAGLRAGELVATDAERAGLAGAAPAR